jgi:hypothetical protein
MHLFLLLGRKSIGFFCRPTPTPTSTFHGLFLCGGSFPCVEHFDLVRAEGVTVDPHIVDQTLVLKADTRWITADIAQSLCDAFMRSGRQNRHLFPLTQHFQQLDGAFHAIYGFSIIR